ncbi:MAG: potassium/proton antiporter [Planctomycetia bacterium]|nr:potassium/proton antiporter [Planctomycetia bacterium]
MLETTYQFLSIGVFLFLGILASKISSFLKVPILIVFLVIGMLAGSEGIGKIDYSNFYGANYVGTLALAFILFSGGYDTSWSDIKKVLFRGTLLSSLGVLATGVLLGIFVAWYLGYSLEWGLLLGCVISSTDAAAVFAIFRSKGFGLKGDLKPLLEYESGSNDPMAAFLTIFMINMILHPGASYWIILPNFVIKMTIGVLVGIIIAKGVAYLFNKLKLEYEGLYYVLGIGTVFIAYSVAELCQGNGFMSVYVCGVVMGNSKFVYKHGLARFNDGLAWLMQVAIFLILGLLVSPSGLIEVVSEGIVIGLALMFIVRPLVVFLCLFKSSYRFKEQILIAWGGFRGAAPIVLATFPAIYGIENSQELFNVVFFIVFTSIIIQGKTLLLLANWFHLDKKDKQRLRAPIEFEETGNSNGRMYEFEIPGNSSCIGKSLAEIQLPGGSLVLLIRRGDCFVVPNGSTVIEANDDLLMFYDPIAYPEVEKILTDNVQADSDSDA